MSTCMTLVDSCECETDYSEPKLECGSFEWTITIDGERNRLNQVQDEIVNLSELYHFDDRTRFDVRVALEEALVNGVKHGNGGDTIKQLRVDYTVNAAEIHVRITDQGTGFDPERVPDPTLPENRERPSGRGLMLMRHYMSGVRHHGCGNCVEMWKTRVALGD